MSCTMYYSLYTWVFLLLSMIFPMFLCFLNQLFSSKLDHCHGQNTHFSHTLRHLHVSERWIAWQVVMDHHRCAWESRPLRWSSTAVDPVGWENIKSYFGCQEKWVCFKGEVIILGILCRVVCNSRLGETFAGLCLKYHQKKNAITSQQRPTKKTVLFT